MNYTLEMKQLADAANAVIAKAKAESRDMTAEERALVKDNLNKAESLKETAELEQRAAQTFGSTREPAKVRDRLLDKPFVSFGEQLQLIHSAAMNPDRVDPRLRELNERAAAGGSIAVPADGGFLIAPQFSSEIIQQAHDTGMIFTRGRKIPLNDDTNAIKIPGVDESSRANGSRWGGVRMYWQNEADSLTSSAPKFRQIELVTKKLTGLYYATDELLRDASALGSVVSQAFGEEVGFKMDDAALNGDGAGKPLGIMQSAALVTVSKENAQTADTVNFANVTKMYFRMPMRNRRNGVWFINQDVEPQLLALATGTNGSIVQGVAFNGTGLYIPAGFNGAEFATLFGRPVIPVEQCATVGDLGDIVFADMSQWMYIDKGNPDAATSMHVKFLTDEMTFRWIYRVDGQPAWHKALTPFKGSNTLSPYITLEAR